MPPNLKKERTGNIVKMLELWADWHSDQPPCDITDNSDVDEDLAMIFKDLIGVEDKQEQLDRLGAQITIVEFYPVNNRTAEAGRIMNAVLRRWWLDIYESMYGRNAA